MSEKGFVHLHLHSQYSLLDGAITFERLFKRCKELGMESVALTDHGNMFGAVEFYIKAREAGVRPIIGMEAYVAPGSRLDKSKTSISDAANHLVLLAENTTGYRNLLKLSSIGFTEGFYYRPRIDKQVLADLHEGLIACSACLKGEIPSAILKGDMAAARKAAEEYAQIFGPDRFFLEVQRHEGGSPGGTPDVTSPVADLAASMGLGVVATNDVHFLDEDDYEAHNCLCAISTGKHTDDPTRLIYPRSVYLKGPDPMRDLFSDVGQACDNTAWIASRCHVELDLKTQHAPRYKPSDGSTPEQFLTRLVYEGAAKRYGEVTTEVKERIARELEVIESKGFSSYFLIVWDFCEHAHQSGIPVGARGSGVGTIVGYCLGLCDVDPIRYDLLFERFMDPQRAEMPDIDIDICQARRQEVIDYVRQKYGHVAQIITFGTMKAKAVIRDVCRVMAVPLDEADRLAKLVPAALDMTLDKALETEPDLKQAYQTNPQTQKVIDIGRKLEGLARHASVHAAGVVVADQPLTDFVPLYKQPGSDDVITQYEGPIVEKVGLLKMDFLGLKTLTVLELAKSLVKSLHGKEIDLEKLDLHDKKTFEIFSSGRTMGIFQFESGGMQSMLMKMKPDRIEDLIAANALYRPGPMTLIPDYIDRKHGAPWSLPHPIMTEILDETYGIMTYQEQVMRICNRLGDIPLREAYKLIKAISKKKADVIAKERERFVAGCTAKGLTEEQAAQVWEIIERFAGYGFNKSHSTRYAFVAYQTAYMKAHWPLEFMAALLTYEMGDTDKLVEYIGECADMGIEVRPPDVNESGVSFTPLYTEQGPEKEKKGRKKGAAGPDSGEKHPAGRKGVIRFGLAGVKGVGERAVEQIIAAREKAGRFQSLFQFCEHVDLRAVNKQVLEALIKAGAFDRLGGNRNQMMVGLERAMGSGASLQGDRLAGQMNLFGQTPAEDYSQDHQRLPDVPPWPEAQMLAFEKEVLGFYVTSNPLSHHAQTIDVYSSTDTSHLAGVGQDKEVLIGGMVTKIRYNLTKTGRNAGAKMAVFTLLDLQGQVDVVLFPSVLSEFGAEVAEDKVVFVKGRVDHSRERPNILASAVIALEDIRRKVAAKVKIRLNARDITEEKIRQIKSICEHHRGKSPIFVAVQTDKGKVYATADKQLSVDPDVEFCQKMRQLVGEENFVLSK
jgi:DNA polymerase-3 subunit alpha